MDINQLYDLKISDLCRYIEVGKYRKILIQLPEGIKTLAFTILQEINKRCNVDVIISGDPSWGACDIPIFEAKRLGVDLIIHYGHYPYPYNPVQREMGIDVLYIPLEYQLETPTQIIEKTIAALEEKGLKSPIVVASAQHIKEAKRMVVELNKKGFKALLPDVLGSLPGLIIGCDYRAVVQSSSTTHGDSIIVIASGLFHALGASLSSDKPTIHVDPIKNEVNFMEEVKNQWLKRRYGVIYKALNASTWAIWIGSLYGQLRFDLAKTISTLVEKRGGSYVFFYSRYVTHRELLSVESKMIDVHVITSCPRVPIDDYTFLDFPKPVLTPGEALMILNNQLEPYRFLW